MPKEATQRAQNVPAENKEAEKTDRAASEEVRLPDAARENETVWQKALEQLKADLPTGEGEARLNGTALLQVTDTAARIGVSNPNALAWLERRMYGQIAKAMKGVLGKDLDLHFVTAC
jgi:hypothetical protein